MIDRVVVSFSCLTLYHDDNARIFPIYSRIYFALFDVPSAFARSDTRRSLKRWRSFVVNSSSSEDGGG